MKALNQMTTMTTILPIFIIISVGALARRRGFINASFLDPANRLVYYLAIPAMIFQAISRSSIGTELNFYVLLIVLVCVLIISVLALAVARVAGIKGGRGGTFAQCAFHGNLGYVGLAVTFYFLGDTGLVIGSILAGLIMILQNLLAVLALHFSKGRDVGQKNLSPVLGRIIINPVILAALAGILFALSGLPMPLIIDRSLKILGGMALPMALLLIGASLSLSLMRDQLLAAMAASGLKLLVMPALGWMAFIYFGLPPSDYLPGLILLAAPPATLTYVFAKEMQGDADLSVASISVGTILSGVTYAGWLTLATLG